MRTIGMFAVTGMLALAAVPASAQTKTLTGETKTVTASVEAIEKATREVTVKKPDGTYDVFYFPESIRRFDTLKVGDKITAKYYENLVLRVKAPGEKDVNSASGGTVRSESKVAGTTSRQRTITATIAAIDPAVAVDHVHRSQRLEVQQPRRGQEGAREGQGGRQARHHLDRSPDPVR